ncbi:MAG: cbb3-type cytochrome oxidase maturation protein [Candidatus Azotimanducaceae bacterium]|jgi:cbb3-type cytochrome oxidase maturation protein
MEGIFILIPLSIVIIFVAIVAFVWSVNDGQYDDLDKEAARILMDDDTPNNTK